MSRIAIAATAGLLLTGCAAIRQQQAIDEQKKEIAEKAALWKASAETARLGIEACKAQFERGDTKTWVARIKCDNSKEEAAFRGTGYPFMDLLILAEANRLVLAEKADRGELTEGQVLLQQADFYSTRIQPEMERRVRAAQDAARQNAMVNAAVNNANAQADAARLNATAGALSVGSQMMQSPAFGGMTCTNFGTVSNCR